MWLLQNLSTKTKLLIYPSDGASVAVYCNEHFPK